MSYPSAPPRLHQIDVVDQVGRAYRIVIDNAQLVIEMALLPFLLVLASEILASLIVWNVGIVTVIIAALIRALGLLIFGTVFIVRWHRFVLLGESVSGGLIPRGWSDFVITGIKLGAIVFAGWIVLFVIAVLPPHFLTVSLAMIGGIALALLSLRVSLIFPAAAIERPAGLRTASDWITGNFWRLFACAFACYLPFLIAQIVIGWIAAIFPSLIWIVFAALQLAVSFVGAAVIAALLSHIYRDMGAGEALA
jgi:hypothetical protein